MKLVDCKVAAEILSVKPTSLMDPRYRLRIGLRAIRLGKSVRFRVEDLEALVKRGEERLPASSH